ncbi:hypothetical protein R3P38DRAFT_3191357 [Favolaschia claudopus]|uniref:Uncharacterized protein n=1 Tax=Favolaschia claudopus TaxID=2862362 RepID=A0AAW0BKX1_9AGAR
MSNPTQCRGVEKDGTQCICLRADETYTDPETGSLKCLSCRHIVSAHPIDSKPKTIDDVGDYVRSFQLAAKAKASGTGHQPLKASREVAAAEMSETLGRPSKKRKSEKPDSDAERPKKASKADKKGKSKEEEPEGEDVEFGKLILLTCGITADGNLRKSTYPDGKLLDKMEQSKLIVEPSKTMKINTGWSRERLQQQLEQYLPQPMSYLAQNPVYPGRERDSEDVRNQSWLPVVKKSSTLTLQTKALPTALQLASIIKRQQGRAKRDRFLLLVSKPKIPESAWKWKQPKQEDASDGEAVLDPGDDALDELASDLDTLPSEDIIYAPSKRPLKKKVVIKKEKGEDLKIVVKKENDEEVDSDEESDMRHAAKMRTRLGTGALTYNADVIPSTLDTTYDEVLVISDSETPPPAPTLESTIAAAPLFNPPSPQSPDIGGPSFLADLGYDWTPSFFPDTSSAMSGPSTSSAGSVFSGGASSSPSPFTASFTLPSSSSYIPTDGGGEPSTVSAPVNEADRVFKKAHRFSRLGKGRSMG